MSSSKRDTDQDWRKVAEEDPFWGVLSQDEYRKDAMNVDALKQFMASGEQYVANIFGFIRKHLAADFSPVRGLDVGCGVGRLAIPMAKVVKEAVGVDIAPAMLALCASHAKLAGVNNLELVESDDTLSRVTGTFDIVNSYIVLQHIPPERGYRLIQAMLDRLNLGGIGSIHLTYAKSRKFLIHEQPKALYYRREGGALIDIIDAGWNPPEGTINMFDYDLNQVMAQLTRASGVPMLLLPTNDDSHLGTHFIFQKVR
jgi:2-polyprenyl-3-methyl-5-hydroxy-6-metoxy-1,4-benzoquinol methylase